jgi:hypothetical protein
MTLRAHRAGVVDVRVRFNPYWRLAGAPGCVSPGPRGWTRLRLDGPGTVRLEPSFSLARIHADGPRCTTVKVR